jgi:hypothetical protein
VSIMRERTVKGCDQEAVDEWPRIGSKPRPPAGAI